MILSFLSGKKGLTQSGTDTQQGTCQIVLLESLTQTSL